MPPSATDWRSFHLLARQRRTDMQRTKSPHSNNQKYESPCVGSQLRLHLYMLVLSFSRRCRAVCAVEAR